jgi:type VI secretion system secreted protein VgrG
MKHGYKFSTIVVGVGLATLLILPSTGFGQTLGSAASYAVLAGSTITNTGATTIVGDVGVSPGTEITGLPAGQPTEGVIHAGDAAAETAQADLTTAYDFLAGMTCTTVNTGVDLGGKTLTPGVYCYASSAPMTGTLTLDAKGDSAAVFVFQIGSTLLVADGSAVNLVNGARASNVWWQVGSSATLGIASAMQGNICAYASITFTTGATLTGRALARIEAVTLEGNAITGIPDHVTATITSSWGAIKSMYR